MKYISPFIRLFFFFFDKIYEQHEIQGGRVKNLNTHTFKLNKEEEMLQEIAAELWACEHEPNVGNSKPVKPRKKQNYTHNHFTAIKIVVKKYVICLF